MDTRVLVTATGSIVGQGIIKSLRLANTSTSSPVRYRIVCADMSPLAAGVYRGDKGVLIPPAISPDYIDSVISLCKKEGISAIFVGSDDELLTLGTEKTKIEKESGAVVLTSPLQALLIARDKWKTYEFLKARGLPVARSALPDRYEELIREFGFPLVVKPRQGYGSLHFYTVKSVEEIQYAVSAIKKAGWDPIVQQYLHGEEFTSGVCIDRNRRYVMASISICKTIKHGQTYKAFIDDYKDVRSSAEEVAMAIGANGCINVQVKLEDKVPIVIEVNPRFSATCPMRAVAGVNEPDIIFRNTVLGEEIRISSYSKLVCMRYWNEVYVPFYEYEKLQKEHRIEGRNSSFIPDAL